MKRRKCWGLTSWEQYVLSVPIPTTDKSNVESLPFAGTMYSCHASWLAHPIQRQHSETALVAAFDGSRKMQRAAYSQRAHTRAETRAGRRRAQLKHMILLNEKWLYHTSSITRASTHFTPIVRGFRFNWRGKKTAWHAADILGTILKGKTSELNTEVWETSVNLKFFSDSVTDWMRFFKTRCAVLPPRKPVGLVHEHLKWH